MATLPPPSTSALASVSNHTSSISANALPACPRLAAYTACVLATAPSSDISLLPLARALEDFGYRVELRPRLGQLAPSMRLLSPAGQTLLVEVANYLSDAHLLAYLHASRCTLQALAVPSQALLLTKRRPSRELQTLAHALSLHLLQSDYSRSPKQAAALIRSQV